MLQRKDYCDDVFEQIDLAMHAYRSRTDEPLPSIESSLLEPDITPPADE